MPVEPVLLTEPARMAAPEIAVVAPSPPPNPRQGRLPSLEEAEARLPAATLEALRQELRGQLREVRRYTPPPADEEAEKAPPPVTFEVTDPETP